MIKTAHGAIETPVFMPVGTRAAVKTLSAAEVKDIGFDVILGNSYHLYLKPGPDVIKEAGGLHRFMAWDGSILTDSGGYQVFSLGPNAVIKQDGVEFRSIYDGSLHFFTPESVIGSQNSFGSDINMVLDVCSGPNASLDELTRARGLTRDWAARSRSAWDSLGSTDHALFGIVQGGTDLDLRQQCVEDIVSIGFDGYALGGLSVGEPHAKMQNIVKACTALLPQDAPRYLMGLGNPTSLIKAVANGIDMFDSVLPTRIARNGTVYTDTGRLNIKNAAFTRDFTPLAPDCECTACRSYSRAYLRHLFMSGEILALRLMSEHNLTFMNRLFKTIRDRIAKGDFESFKKEFLGTFHETVF